jgi:hypothetical protein
MAFLFLLGWMVVENQYPTKSETPSSFGCGYAALCIAAYGFLVAERNLFSPSARADNLGLVAPR